jgi:hypothetical protein
MRDGTATRKRRIDNGDPLLLVDPPLDSGADAYVVSTAVCDNPECTCTRMWLDIRPADETRHGIVKVRGPVLAGEVSSDGSDLTLEDAGVFDAAVTEWLRERLSEEDHRSWLSERWRRLRGQIGDPAYPPQVEPRRDGWLLSFWEVFPYDFDLTVVHDEHLYLADDQYCVNPGCTCDDVVVQFIDTSREGENLGHARASVRRLRAVTTEGSPEIRPLWNALLEDHGHRPLRERFRRMRALADRPPRPQRQVLPPRGGRNAPCPCGSGKKLKRCCGA